MIFSNLPNPELGKEDESRNLKLTVIGFPPEARGNDKQRAREDDIFKKLESRNLKPVN